MLHFIIKIFAIYNLWDYICICNYKRNAFVITKVTQS